jgi:hypothetical protein
MTRFRDLRDFVEQGYHVETKIGRFLVCRRGPAVAP